jgi:putative addiction module component (TIGR02574 family)
MARPLATLEHEIRALGTADKEALLRVLWEELDGQPDTEVESAWLAEAQRRSAEIDSGAVETVPADQVFAKLETKFRK